MQAAHPPFTCTHTREFPELLADLGCSLIISTYQAGKVILLSSDGETLSQLPRTFDTPMGLALKDSRLAVAAKNEIVLLVDEPRLAVTYPNKPNFYDSLFVPRSSHYCGRLNIHDMAWTENGLVGVNTLFSCLFLLDDNYSFVSFWKPPFISTLAPEDRCHLNGMALDEDKPRYVTALGQTDSVQGWRDDKLNGGLLIDVESGELILQGLGMPHSPRIYDGELYLLISTTGEIVKVNTDKGTYDVVNKVEGFLRGMSRYGDYLFIGSSLLRKTHTFGDLDLAKSKKTFCGVVVLHLPTGAVVGQIQYVNSCEEIYDVHVLPGLKRPGILGTSSDMYQRALTISESIFWGKEDEK